MTSVNERLLPTVVWVGFTALTTFMTFLAGGFPAIYSVEIRLITQAIALAVIVIWLGSALLRPDLFPRSRLIPAVVAVLAALTISALASRWPRFGLETVVSAAGAALLYLLLVRLCASPVLRPRIRFTMTVTIVLVAIAYVVQVGILWTGWYSVTGATGLPPLRPANANLTLGTPSVVAALLILVGPLVLAWSVARSRPLALAVAAVLAVAIIMTGSRGGWLGAAAAAGAALVILAGRWLWMVRGQVGRPIGWRVLGTGALAMVAVVALVPLATQRLAATGGTVRFSLWQMSTGMFLDQPLTGAGPGTWAFASWAHRDRDMPIRIVAHAHNIVIQTAAELGLVGLLAGLLVVVAGARLMHASVGQLPWLEVVAIAAGLVGLLAQSMVDNFADLPIMILGVLFVLAWIDGRLAQERLASRPMSAPHPRRGRLVAGSLLGACAASGVLILVPWAIAMAQFREGARALDAGDLAPAIRSLNRAVELDPHHPAYGFALGLAEARAGDPSGAAATLGYAAALTDDPFIWAATAIMAAEAEQQLPAQAALTAASTPGVVNVPLALNVGLVAERLGQDNLATGSYATALAAAPTLSGSTFWTDPARRVARAEVLEAASRRIDELDIEWEPPIVRSQLWLFAGEPSRARDALAKAAETPQKAAQTLLIDWMDGDATAKDRLEDLAVEHPQDQGVVVTAALASADDEPAQGRYDSWILFLNPDAAGAGRVPVIIGPTSNDTAAFVRVGFGLQEQIYLRNGPLNAFPPGWLSIGYR